MRDHDYGGVDNINTIQDLFSDQEALDIITAVANVNFSSNPKEGKKAEVYYDTKRLADDMRENPPEPIKNESNGTSSIINQDNNKDSTMGLSGTPRMKYNLGLEGVPISDEDDPESDELVIEKLNSLDDTGETQWLL